jgi:hypothetical protein
MAPIEFITVSCSKQLRRRKILAETAAFCAARNCVICRLAIASIAGYHRARAREALGAALLLNPAASITNLECDPSLFVARLAADSVKK